MFTLGQVTIVGYCDVTTGDAYCKACAGILEDNGENLEGEKFSPIFQYSADEYASESAYSRHEADGTQDTNWDVEEYDYEPCVECGRYIGA